MGDKCGEAVVVAEANLVGGHRVVLVHDRNHAEGQQAVQRRLSVAVVRAADNVVGGEQDLTDRTAVAGEGRCVPLHQQRLPHRRGGLQRGEVARPLGDT